MSITIPYLQRYRLFLNDPKLRRVTEVTQDHQDELESRDTQNIASFRQSLPERITTQGTSHDSPKGTNIVLSQLNQVCDKIKSIEQSTDDLKRKIDQQHDNSRGDEDKFQKFIEYLDTRLSTFDKVTDQLEGIKTYLREEASPQRRKPIQKYSAEGQEPREVKGHLANNWNHSKDGARPSDSLLVSGGEVLEQFKYERIFNQKLKQELEILHVKCGVLIKENELLVSENKKLHDEIKREHREKNQESIKLGNLSHENIDLKEKMNSALTYIKSLESENLKLKESKNDLIKENRSLKELVKFGEQARESNFKNDLTFEAINIQLKERNRDLEVENQSLQSEINKLIGSVSTMQKERDTVKNHVRFLESISTSSRGVNIPASTPTHTESQPNPNHDQEELGRFKTYNNFRASLNTDNNLNNKDAMLVSSSTAFSNTRSSPISNILIERSVSQTQRDVSPSRIKRNIFQQSHPNNAIKENNLVITGFVKAGGKTIDHELNKIRENLKPSHPKVKKRKSHTYSISSPIQENRDLELESARDTFNQDRLNIRIYKE